MSGGQVRHRVQFYCKHYSHFRGSRPEIGDLIYCWECSAYKHVTWTQTSGTTTPREHGQEVCQISDIP